MAGKLGPARGQYPTAVDKFDGKLPCSRKDHTEDPRMQRFAGNTSLYLSLASTKMRNINRDSGHYESVNSSPYGRVSYDEVANSSPHQIKPRGGIRAIQHDGRGGFGTMKQDFTRQLGSSGVAPYGVPRSMPAPIGNARGASRTSKPVLDIESENEKDELSEYSEETEDTEDDEWNIDSSTFIIAAEDCNTHTEKPGTVREGNGYLEWLEPKTKRWYRACIHHNIRQHLMARARASHPNQTYVYPVNAGNGPYDEISFHADYQNWGTERKQWAKILFELDPPMHRRLSKPGIMMFDGMIVLNHQNNPVLDWNIPATLSSTTPGCFLEAWKRKFGMSHQDLRARMVRYTFETVNGRTICKALNVKNTVVNMPMQRFRDEAGCIGWLRRQPNIRTGLIKLMKSEGVDPEVNNSTKEFGRELTREEQLEVKKGENSIFPVHESAGEKSLFEIKSSHKNARNSKKRDREDTEDALEAEEEGGADFCSGILFNSRRSFAERSPNTRSSKRIRTSKESEICESNKNNMVTYDGEHEAKLHSTNSVPMLRAISRVQKTGINGKTQSRQGTNYCKPARPSRKRPEYLKQAIDEDSGSDHEMSENDADIDAEVSGSEFGSDDEYDGKVGEDYGPPTVQETRRLEDYFGGPLPHEEDLKTHRASVRHLLGEDCMAEYEGGFKYSRYAYPKRSVEPEHRHFEGAQKAKPILRRQNGTDIRAAKDAHAITDYREVAPANELQCQSIERALQATREAFFEYTGFEAPITKRTESYAAQWNQIRSGFEEFDWSEEPDGEAPYFPHLPAWHTSLETIPAHVKDTMYYEAWHRGHRTPTVRLPNGDAFDLPGEFLERIGRYPNEERAFLLDERYRAMGFKLRSNPAKEL